MKYIDFIKLQQLNNYLISKTELEIKKDIYIILFYNSFTFSSPFLSERKNKTLYNFLIFSFKDINKEINFTFVYKFDIKNISLIINDNQKIIDLLYLLIIKFQTCTIKELENVLHKYKIFN